jgi:hypothetical protein
VRDRVLLQRQTIPDAAFLQSRPFESLGWLIAMSRIKRLLTIFMLFAFHSVVHKSTVAYPCHSRFMKLPFIYFCITALLFIAVGAAISKADGPESANEPMSVQEIVESAVERAENQHMSMIETNFSSQAVSKNHSLDGDGTITETESFRSLQYPLNGAVFEELVEKNGRPLDEKEKQDEEKRKQDFIREVEKRRTRGDYVQPSKEEAIRFNREFTDRYIYELERTETIREHSCWVISFEPKQGKLPVRNRMDRALNKITGLMWISRDDYGLVRVEFALREPFKYWGGILAVVRNTDGTVNYTRVEPNVWLPLHFNLRLDLKIMLVKNIRRLIVKDWFDYKRVDNPLLSDPATAQSTVQGSSGNTILK